MPVAEPPAPSRLTAAVHDVITAATPWTDADAQALLDLGIGVPPDHLCIASTGVLADPGLECDQHRDGAHRCLRPPDHQRGGGTSGRLVGRHSVDHVCLCGFVWTSAKGGMAGLQQEWLRVGNVAVAAALVEVLAQMKASGLPGLPVLSQVVRDVAREMKIDLVEK